MIEVSGIGIDDFVMCLLFSPYPYEFIKIQPIWVTYELILCEVPSHIAQDFKFELTYGKDSVPDHTTSSGFTFFYYNNPHIISIFPRHVSTRANELKIVIGCTGFNFLNTGDMVIEIGGTYYSNATFVNSTYITFIAPAVIEPIQYRVALSNNDLDYSLASKNVTLTYNPDFGITYLKLDRVQLAQIDNVTITFQGEYLPYGKIIDFYCIFAPAYYSNGVVNKTFTPVIMRATIQSLTQVSCVNVPTIFNGVALNENIFLATLSLSFDQQEMMWNHTIIYFPKPTLTQTSPRQIPQYQSEIALTLNGDKLIDAGGLMKCLLTSKANPNRSFFALQVIYKNSKVVQCLFSIVPNDIYKIGIAFNGVQINYFNDTINYLDVIDAIQIREVHPHMIITRQLGQVLYIQSENLVPNLWCIFEHEHVSLAPAIENQFYSLSRRIDNNLIICPVPNLGGPGSGNIKLLLSIDPIMKLKTQSYFRLNITDQCPPGFSCEGGEIKLCAYGHSCKGGFIEQPQKLCPIGYYQDRIGNPFCKACPYGFICPFFGMQQPMPCPAGFSCGAQILTEPYEECPPGQYCRTGREGRQPFKNGLFTRMNDLCPPGAYCKGGNPSGLVLLNSNSSSAYPCPQGSVCSEGSYDLQGVGYCPAGSYCPTPAHSGILCPPRHYCYGRGNSMPLRCPRGTFNMHFGAQECTSCTLGMICPVEGLFLPMPCPPGYACNGERITIPYNLCKIGHICQRQVSSGTLSMSRSCQILRIIGGYDQCLTGIVYKIQELKQFSTIGLPAYFFEMSEQGETKVDACCWNNKAVANWFSQIGQSNGQERAFGAYRDMILTATKINNKTGIPKLQPLWDGMRLVDKAVLHYGLDSTDLLKIPFQKHRKLVLLYNKMMYTSQQAQLCPGGLLCLEAVSTQNQSAGSGSTPYACPSGSFCLTASDTVIGTSLCPVGYYCPSKTTYPLPSPPGFFTQNFGSVEPASCPAGTFQLDWSADGCNNCPVGYQCRNSGTSTPIICAVGFYRSAVASNICEACPFGSFSYERGSKDVLECQECPPGRICVFEGSSNVSVSIPCTDGMVCRPGTGAKAQTFCEPGYFCPPSTSQLTQYDKRCEAGFFCRYGTGFQTRTRDNCPQSYYCPPGTGIYNYAIVYSDYANWRQDAPTRCPQGTGLDGQDTKNSMLQCSINVIYRLLFQDINIRQAVQVTRSLQAINIDTNFEAEESDGTGDTRNLQAIQGRELQGTQAASKSDPRLQKLFEIDYEYGQFLIGSNPTPIRTFINTNRQYTARWSPLNLSLIDTFNEIEAFDIERLETDVPNCIFDLPPLNYALVTLDLRHLPQQTQNWTYGDDWAISFTLEKDILLGNTSRPQPMPEDFLDVQVSKSQIFELQVFAWQRLRLRVDILCYNGLFINYRYLFLNSTSVSIRRPNRALYGTQKIFGYSIQAAFGLALPINQPGLVPDISDPFNSYPSNYISFAQNPQNDIYMPIRHKSVKQRNIWIPSELYWQSRNRINMPYLPYFSNCMGYGSQIPLWGLIEQHHLCELVEQQDTVFVTPWSFGLPPTADMCNATLITCYYDEIIAGQQPMPRWFEQQGGNPIFEITVDPVMFYDFMVTDFAAVQVLQMSPADNAAETQQIPTFISITIEYFQIDKNKKKIIATDMSYEKILSLTDDQFNGAEKIAYNISFNFVGLDHRQLTIDFAFSSIFYMMLYVIVAVLSVAFITVFTCYHRLMARPNPGKKVFPFKFYSYLALKEPPAVAGVGLALIPILCGTFFIAIVVSGHVFLMRTYLFACEAPNDQECQYTILDIFPADVNAVTTDYTMLRFGRTGVSFLCIGIYCMYAAMAIMMPDKTDKTKISQSYDGNIWDYFIWKKSNMIYVTLFCIIFGVFLIQFSFSAIYADYQWTVIGGLMVVCIALEVVIENEMDDLLLIGCLTTVIGNVMGTITFGSPDFLAFLNGNYMDLGITLADRIYIGDITDLVIDSVLETLPKVIDSITNFFIAEDEEEVEVEEEVVEEQVAEDQYAEEEVYKAPVVEEEVKELLAPPPIEDEDESLTSKSDVYYSEEEPSANANQSDDLGQDDPDACLNVQNESEGSDADEMLGQLQRLEDKEVDKQDWIRKKKQQEDNKKIVIAQEGDKKSEEEYKPKVEKKVVVEEEVEGEEGEQEQEEEAAEEEAAEEEKSEVDVDLDEDAEEQEVEDLIGEYSGYAGDTLSLYYQPLFVALLWSFYDEIQIAPLYGIQEKDFFLYFLYSLFTMPPSIVVDICCLNVFEWYQKKPVHDYLDYLKLRYQNRKARWKGDEPKTNTKIEIGLQSIDQLCFSSQYFFVQTIYVSGALYIVLGIQILVCAPSYNLFGDIGLLPTVLLNYAACILIEKLCRAGGQYFKIWKIDESIERMERQDESLNIDGYFRDLAKYKQQAYARKNQTPISKQFNLAQWRVIQNAKVEEELLKNELATNRIGCATYRELFMQNNRPWLQSNIHEVFTPRTLFLNRQNILEQFQQVLGTIKPDVSTSSFSDVEKNKNSQSSKAFNDSQSKAGKSTHRRRIEGTATAMIARYWLVRMRFIRILRIKVQAVTDLNLEDTCLYCGAEYNLSVELIQNIEEMFKQFLTKTNTKIQNYKYQAWMRYYRERAQYRTTCMECQEIIADYHKKKNKLELYDRDPFKEGFEFMQQLDQKIALNTLQRTQTMQRSRKIQMGERQRLIVKKWIAMARESLAQRK